MKQTIAWLTLVCLSHTPMLCAQNGLDAADVTVRLYSTLVVSKLHIAPSHATVRTCATCRPLLATQMDLAWDRSGNSLLANRKPSKALWFDGQIQTTADDGKLESAAGHWVISASKDGLHVLLMVPSERYVMAVLAAEAAPSEPIEPLKALAVTARSFALTNPHRHGAEGLCDSTHCQALRMSQVPESVRRAVLETAGETLWFGGRQVPGYFTQNCGGETAAAAQAWGGAKKPWLTAHPDNFCRRTPALWHAELKEEQLRNTLEAEGWHVPQPLGSVKVAAEDSSGRATKLEFVGNGQKLLVNASSLRFAIDRALGWNQLRSDWYTVHFVAASHKLLFDGKGYGHGVGLCQAGAAEMARQGRSYRDILAFYFQGAKVAISGTDSGWHIDQAQGWSLRSTGTLPEIIAAGNRALAKARQLWQSDHATQPVVTLPPTTELFRQLTNAPGWELASTSGSSITMQPVAVLAKHGSIENLMLHEFLHSMVESEANTSTPLWLREGLVEVLAGEDITRMAMQPEAINKALSHAGTLQQAQQAHLAAYSLVQSMMGRYGMSNVRLWLRNGVPAGVLAAKQLRLERKE